MAIAFLDWGLAGSVLYTLMAPFSKLSWSGFLGVYLLAQLAGLTSQLPGEVEHSGEILEETVVVEVFSPVREEYL